LPDRRRLSQREQSFADDCDGRADDHLIGCFVTCPAPASPTWTMFLPSFSKIGMARSTAETLPPIMIDRLAAMAPASPPLTGASSMSQPRFSASAASFRPTTGEMLDMSISNVPDFTPVKIRARRRRRGRHPASRAAS
jgi:hypothetical protein